MIPLPIYQVDVMVPYTVVAVRRGMFPFIVELHAQADVAEALHIRINPAGNPVVLRPVFMIHCKHSARYAHNAAPPAFLVRYAGKAGWCGKFDRIFALAIGVSRVQRNRSEIFLFAEL